MPGVFNVKLALKKSCSMFVAYVATAVYDVQTPLYIVTTKFSMKKEKKKKTGRGILNRGIKKEYEKGLEKGNLNTEGAYVPSAAVACNCIHEKWYPSRQSPSSFSLPSYLHPCVSSSKVL